MTLEEMNARVEQLAKAVDESAQSHNKLVGHFHEATTLRDMLKAKLAAPVEAVVDAVAEVVAE